MKCKNCGAELISENGLFKCIYCNSSFTKEELLPSNGSHRKFTVTGGVLTSYFGNDAEIVIPDNVVVIGNETFKHNVLLNKVTFSNTVTFVDKSAFEGCINLTKIEGYSNITKYGDECFKFTGLKSVTIGANVRYLGKGCFSRMPNLEKVCYYATKDLKLNHTFSFCENLKEVEEDRFHFFPSEHKTFEVKNNINNKRPTFGDAFSGTPYITEVLQHKYRELYDKGICPECGGTIKHGLFHRVCKNCGIDYIN